MGIKVHVDIAKLEQKLNDTQLRRGRLAMANDAHQAMEKYVPKKEGTLRETSKVAIDVLACIMFNLMLEHNFMVLLLINMAARLGYIITPRLEHQDVGI